MALSASDVVELIGHWVKEYDTEIRPLRDDPDRGIGTYVEYDEAASQFFEEFFADMRDFWEALNPEREQGEQR